MPHPAVAQPFVSVTVPVYRSAKTLKQLVDGIRDVTNSQNWSREIILVDDSSPDEETRAELRSLSGDADVRVVTLRMNRGQHPATLVGLSLSQNRFSVVMDADLQQDPSCIPSLLGPLLDSSQLDAVIAAFPESRHGLPRRIGSRIVGSVLRWSNNLPPGFVFTSFLAMNASVREIVVTAGTKRLDPVIGTLLVEVSDRVVNVKVPHYARSVGRSAWSLGRLVRLALQLIQSVLFTRRGLHALSSSAIAVGLLALVLAAAYLMRFFFGGRPLTGFTTTVLLLLASFATSSFLLSALLHGMAGLRDAVWRDIPSDIRTDSWNPLPDTDSIHD